MTMWGAVCVNSASTVLRGAGDNSEQRKTDGHAVAACGETSLKT